MVCAYMRPRYQVGVYRTIGPLVCCTNPHGLLLERSINCCKPQDHELLKDHHAVLFCFVHMNQIRLEQFKLMKYKK